MKASERREMLKRERALEHRLKQQRRRERRQRRLSIKKYDYPPEPKWGSPYEDASF